MIIGANPNPAPTSRVLATVNGKPITQEDVADYIASMGARGEQLKTPEGQAKVLEQLIGQKLLVEDATRNLYDHEPEFLAELSHVKDNLLFSYALNKMLAGIQAKDEEVRKYFDEHKEQFTGQPTVNASHILVAEEEKAKEIMGRIESGEITFEEAAHQYSTCPSAQQGGNLGEFGQGQMVPEFDKACFSMEPGELRGPVKTDFGWHIIRLNSKSQSEDMKFEDIAPQLKQQLTIEKQQAAYQSKINQLKILYPVNKV